MADRIFVMAEGKMVMEGRPWEVFSKEDKLKEWRLVMPQSMELMMELKKMGMKIPEGILTKEDLAEFLGKA